MNRATPASFSPLVPSLFFVSGATALVYEVIWLRKLILVFGSTLFATSTILSTFMGGLALGAYLAGRVMEGREVRPLRVFGLLEAGIGVYALAVPTLLDALTPAYRKLWELGASESFLLFSLCKFVGIAAVLLPPTMLMGASLPVLSRQVADDPRRIGGKVGTLYAVNTFGAVAGTFLAGFVMIPGLGVWVTIQTAAAVNVAVGVGALVVGAWLVPPASPARSSRIGHGAAEPSSTRIRLALVAFAISGFSAMALEVAWTRALALVLGSSVYAFSLMLVSFLVGLASGGAVFSGLLRRRPELDAGGLLAGLLGAAGVLAYATAFTLEWLPRIFAEIYFRWHPSPEGWFAVQFVLGLLVMFPATFAFGGIFPAVVQLHARSIERVPSSVGVVYASNTTGTIAGAALAGFLLIPQLGVRTTVVTIAFMEIALGLAVVAFMAGRDPRRRAALALPMVAALVAIPLVRPGWDVLIMNSGVYMNLQDLPEDSTWEEFRHRSTERVELVYAREGLTASVIVADEPELDNRYLSVNGKVEASTQGDMETQLMCSHLPLLLHPGPQDVMVIGLASGISVGAAATHPVDHVRVVEVEAAMEPAARLFAAHNGNVLDDERVRLSINDARNELAFSSRMYDVIVSEPSNPWMTVASNLFTEDFFRLARTRMRPGGIFSQWVQTYYLPTEDMRAIVGAFRAAFPHVVLFETFEGVDLILLGSDRPIRLDLDRLDRRMQELRVRLDLARVGIRGWADVIPLFRLGEAEVDRLVEGAVRNTDDNARVEFSAPKAIYSATLDANLALLERHRADCLEYLSPPPASREEEDRIRLAVAQAWLRRGNPRRAAALATAALEGPLSEQAEAFLAGLSL